MQWAMRLLAALALVTVTVSRANALALYDGTNLNGWAPSGGSAWSVQNGYIVNDGFAPDAALAYNTTLGGSSFTLSIDVNVLNFSGPYPRPRFELTSQFGQFYFGNEGYTDQYQVYGSDLSSYNQITSPAYYPDSFNFLTLVADGDNLSFYINGTLSATATRSSISPLNLTITPGDGYSSGELAISSVDYTPEPACASGTAAVLALGLLRRRIRFANY